MIRMKSPTDAAFDPYHLWLQIPKETRPPTHYQLLGLAVGEADPEVIRQATLMRSAYVRHFQTGANAADANRILEELADASRVLLDPALRTEYEKKVKPAAKAAPKPAVATNAKPVVITPPTQSVPDYEVVGGVERRPKVRKSKRKSHRTLVNNIFGIVVLGIALGIVGYLASVYNRSSTTPFAKGETATKVSKEAGTLAEQSEKSNSEASDPAIAKAARPRPADALIVRLSVEPANAQLSLEPIGDAPPSGSKASLEGDGSDRTIVAEKGSLPLVIAASANGYQSNRITVFSSDAGRLVVVQLQKGSGKNLLAEGPRPISSSNRTGRRTVGNYRTGIALASKDSKPVWKYTVNRPAQDWTSPTFGDVLWTEGEGAFATKAGKNAVRVPGLWVRTPWASRDIWLRVRIDLPPEIKDANIRWMYRHDENIQVYVNGVMQFAEPSFNMQVRTRELDGTNFKPGENVIAVHCRNNGGPGLVDVGLEWIATEEVK
jgi:hypothetical protein